MRKAKIFVHNILAGYLEELIFKKKYSVAYINEYGGPPISLTMPTETKTYHFDSFPSFFDGVLPEGIMLEGLLRTKKIDRDDCFSQLMAVGKDLVGCITVLEIKEPNE